MTGEAYCREVVRKLRESLSGKGLLIEYWGRVFFLIAGRLSQVRRDASYPAGLFIIICQARSGNLWARFWFSCQQVLIDDRYVWTLNCRWTRPGGTAEPVGISSGTTVALSADIDRSTDYYKNSQD